MVSPRMQAKCSPEAHSCNIFPGGTCPRTPPAVEYLWCVDTRALMPAKVNFLANTTTPQNGWLRACFTERYFTTIKEIQPYFFQQVVIFSFVNRPIPVFFCLFGFFSEVSIFFVSQSAGSFAGCSQGGVAQITQSSTLGMVAPRLSNQFKWCDRTGSEASGLPTSCESRSK